MLFGEQRNAGWSAELLNPNALLLVPGYLLLATLAFAAIGRAARRRPARYKAIHRNGPPNSRSS